MLVRRRQEQVQGHRLGRVRALDPVQRSVVRIAHLTLQLLRMVTLVRVVRGVGGAAVVGRVVLGALGGLALDQAHVDPGSRLLLVRARARRGTAMKYW